MSWEHLADHGGSPAREVLWNIGLRHTSKQFLRLEEDGGSVVHIYTEKLKSLLLQGTGIPLKPLGGWALESELL